MVSACVLPGANRRSVVELCLRSVFRDKTERHVAGCFIINQANLKVERLGWPHYITHVPRLLHWKIKVMVDGGSICIEVYLTAKSYHFPPECSVDFY